LETASHHLFGSCCDILDPPPFPTRRSSDLGLPAAGQQLQDADRPVHRLHRALCAVPDPAVLLAGLHGATIAAVTTPAAAPVTDRSEEHTSELQSRENLVCRLLLEKKDY